MKADIKKDDDFIIFDDDVYIHSTKAGKLYIKPSELFARDRIKKMLQKLLESSISKNLEKA